MKKLLNIQSLLWLALALALAGSLKHLAAIFASVDGNTLMGWLQAIAIDTGLFALAYSIRKRRADKRPVKPLWFGVVLFSVISIYGNLAYGLLSTNGSLPTWIMVTKPIVLAASLPVLVLFLSELLSGDRQHLAELAEREAKRQPRPATDADRVPFVPGDLSALDKANEARLSKLKERRQMVLSLLAEGLSEDDIADRLQVSLRTIQRDIIFSKNGQVTK